MPGPNCPQGEKAVLRHYGELDPKEAAAYEAHLAACPACRRAVADAAEVAQALDRDLVPLPSERALAACREAVRAAVARDAALPAVARGSHPAARRAFPGTFYRIAAALLLIATGFGLAQFVIPSATPEIVATERARLLCLVGDLYLAQGRYPEARETLDDARRDDPSIPTAAERLSDLTGDRADGGAAGRLLDEVAGLAPDVALRRYARICSLYPSSGAARGALLGYARREFPDEVRGMPEPPVIQQLNQISPTTIVVMIPEVPGSPQVFALRPDPVRERARDPEIRAYAAYLMADELIRNGQPAEAARLLGEAVAMAAGTPLAALAESRR